MTSPALSSAKRLVCLLALSVPFTAATALAQATPSPEAPPAVEPSTDAPAPAAPPPAANSEPAAPATPTELAPAPEAPPSAPSPALPAEPPAEPAAPPVEPELPAPAPEYAPAEPPAATPEPAPAEAAPVPPPASNQPLEVTIVGTRLSRTPGSAHVIRDKELQRFEYDDVAQVLSAVPGVYSRTEDGMGLRPNIAIRGVDPDRSKKITLMEDGVLFGPAPYSAPAAYYFPIITRMTGVRVIKGPSAVTSGPQTIAGAVDLQTRAIPTNASGAIDLAAGAYGYGKGHAYFGASNDQFGFLVEGVRLQNNGFKELMTNPDADTGFTKDEWMAKFSYVVDPRAEVRNEFRLKLGYSDEVSNETYMGLSEQDFKDNPYARYGATANDRMKNHRSSIALTHQVDFKRRMTLTTTAYRNNFTRLWNRVDNIPGANLFDVLDNTASASASPNSPAGMRYTYLSVLRGQSTFADALGDPNARVVSAGNQRDFVSEGVQSLFRWDTETGKIQHRFEAGMRLHYDRIERHHTAFGSQLYGGEPYPDGQATTVTAFNKAATYALAPHVQYAVTVAGLTVTPGMRTELMRMSFIDRATGNGDKFFNYALLPGVGLYYAITEELGVLAGVYRGFSAATPDAGKHAKPEFSVNYEGGARYTKGALRAEAIGFYNDYQNISSIGNDGGPSSAQDKYFTGGHARIYGVELLVGHDIPVGNLKLPLTFAYTRTQAQFLETFSSQNPIWGDVEKGDLMPNVPQHLMRASLGVEAKPAGGAVAVSYMSKTGDGSTGVGSDHRELYTDAQTLVDASAWAKVWGPLQIYGTINNLLNSVYLVSHRPFGARPNAPRWFHIGLKAAF
ncbi:MAG: TonB-dependent receptor [Myxococcales bacterium]